MRLIGGTKGWSQKLDVCRSLASFGIFPVQSGTLLKRGLCSVRDEIILGQLWMTSCSSSFFVFRVPVSFHPSSEVLGDDHDLPFTGTRWWKRYPYRKLHLMKSDDEAGSWMILDRSFLIVLLFFSQSCIHATS